MLKSYVMRLIVLLLKEISTGSGMEEESPIKFESYDKAKVVATIADFINNNYSQDISLDRISRNMYLSPAYISKIFKDETGESPINYLIKVRLSKAAELLEEGSISIKNVQQVDTATRIISASCLKVYEFPCIQKCKTAPGPNPVTWHCPFK